MKYYLGIFIVLAGQTWAADMTEIKTEKDKLSYSIGASIGKNLKKDATDVDLDVLIKGMKSAMSGQKLLMSDNDVRQVMASYQNDLRKRSMLTRQEALVANKKKGEDFLAENKTKDGVVTLPSGVQYQIIKAGKGKTPLDSDTIEVNYRGSLIDGTTFDATEPDHPATFKLSALIAGWKEALRLMPSGSKWKIFIPSQLAYGERGAGSDIGPNEALIFEVELLAIK